MNENILEQMEEIFIIPHHPLIRLNQTCDGIKNNSLAGVAGVGVYNLATLLYDSVGIVTYSDWWAISICLFSLLELPDGYKCFFPHLTRLISS